MESSLQKTKTQTMPPNLRKSLFWDVRYEDNIFDIPKENFRCYHTEPSIRKLWDY